MEKIFDLGVETYVAAKPLKRLNVYDHISMIASVLFDIVKFIVFSFPCFIESFVHLFISRPMKNVTGQVVLVKFVSVF